MNRRARRTRRSELDHMLARFVVVRRHIRRVPRWLGVAWIVCTLDAAYRAGGSLARLALWMHRVAFVGHPELKIPFSQVGQSIGNRSPPWAGVGYVVVWVIVVTPLSVMRLSYHA